MMNKNPHLAVVGAGPAGVSSAIRFAQAGLRVTLIERDRFPRHKLCGEFISPECFRHFRELGVSDQMFSVGGDRITETIFYAPSGKSVVVPSDWLDKSAAGALSLSRAEMDFVLLEQAKSLGVDVLEETSVVGLLLEKDAARGVKVRLKNGGVKEICADATIDATGRSNVLAKLFKKSRVGEIPDSRFQTPDSKPKTQNRLVGFKTHLKNVAMEKGRCEIYFFRGGYGGLSFVENNLANHCFLIKAEVVKEFGGNADKIVEGVIFKNRRARETMANAAPVFDWLAVSVDGFGRKNLNPAKNLLTVGDAAAFIDPFTGSGMLMALESAETLAQIIIENAFSGDKIAEIYQMRHRERFQKRLRICSLIRRAAFVPNLAGLAISALSLSKTARIFLAHSTRPPLPADKNEL